MGNLNLAKKKRKGTNMTTVSVWVKCHSNRDLSVLATGIHQNKLGHLLPFQLSNLFYCMGIDGLGTKNIRARVFEK